MRNTFYTLITGASEGLGKSLAFECARRKMNLVLVALPGPALHFLADFIMKNYEVNVYYFEMDLTRKEDCIALYNKVKDLQIDVNILINNAGIGGTFFFHERDADYYQHQIQLNVIAPTILTRMFMDDLKKNSPSFILNVSSLAGFFYLPKKQVYGGTKSYLVSFSKSLRSELKHEGIQVAVLCPGGMNTTLALIMQNRSGNRFARWSVMDPENVAPIAIKNMLLGKSLIVPGFWNRCFLWMDKILPAYLKEKLTDFQMSQTKVYRPIAITNNFTLENRSNLNFR